MSFFKSILGGLSFYDMEEDTDYLSEEEDDIKVIRKSKKSRLISIERSRKSDLNKKSINADIPYTLMNQIIQRKQVGFSETLLNYCNKSLMKDSVLYKKAGIDRKHFSKIRSNVNYKPTKNTVFAFILALELPLEEAKNLLLSAGYSLSNSFETDIIISYYLERNIYDIDIINDMLYRRNLNTI